MSEMITASDFLAATERRRLETEQTKTKRRETLVKKAKKYWPELAKEIEKKAIWHLHHAEIPSTRVVELLRLSSKTTCYNDIEHVIKTLAESYGFKIESQYETLPKGWIFSWSKAKG